MAFNSNTNEKTGQWTLLITNDKEAEEVSVTAGCNIVERL